MLCTELLISDAYRAVGAILWPDLWGSICSDASRNRVQFGDTAHPAHVMWRAGIAGLQWQVTNSKHSSTIIFKYLPACALHQR